MQMHKLYLDYAATTPVDPIVVEKMMPFFNTIYGNPSSIHVFGQEAEAAVEDAREKVARVFQCQSREVVFTSGGSESDNLAIRGVALAARKYRNANKILISPVEHHAVSNTVKQMIELFGFEIEFIPVDRYGMVDPEDVAARLNSNVALVSIIYANNEVGTINPIHEIGGICRSLGIPLHTDAVQAAAYLPMSVDTLNADLISIGAHKFYGPKGVGALYIRSGIPIFPINTGGGQESGMRAGTHNVPYIVGLAEAFAIAQLNREQRSKSLLPMRDCLVGIVLEEIPDSQLTGHPTLRLPNHSSFVFKNIDGNALLTLLDIAGYACSSGSACKTGNPEPSEVLTAMGFSGDWALGSLRVTLGSSTAPEHIQNFSQTLIDQIQKLRNPKARRL